MELTNKLNGSFFWREAGNRLFLEIDGKPFELKYTVAQNEAYEAFIEDRKAKLAAEKKDGDTEKLNEEIIASLLKRGIDSALDILEIAFNPKRDREFTRDQIKEVFSEHVDLIRIVANTWFEKKLLNPALSNALDPQLAPRDLGA